VRVEVCSSAALLRGQKTVQMLRKARMLYECEWLGGGRAIVSLSTRYYEVGRADMLLDEHEVRTKDMFALSLRLRYTRRNRQ
jgi:hypothetical protein